MGGIAEQGDTEGAVRFHDFLFKSVQILTCYGFFSASPSSGPDNVGAHALKSTLTCERKREAGVGVEEEGKVRERGRQQHWSYIGSLEQVQCAVSVLFSLHLYSSS